MLMQLNGNETLSCHSGYVGDFPPTHNVDYFYHYYPIWYPSISYITEKSKIEQAFKIVGKLLESKIITKDLTIKEFMKLINDVAEVI